MPRELSLGKQLDPATGALGARVDLDSADLLTHGLIVGMTGSGKTAAEKLRDKLEKMKGDLAAREQDLSGRKAEKWTSIGTALLSNIGLLTGRKRTISGAGAVLSKNRMENTAEAKVEALKAEIAGLESDLVALATVDPARFESRQVVPARSDVTILRYDLVWVF